MANQETQILDDIIVKSRRKMLTLGGTALAGLVMGGVTKSASAQTASYTDADILNFALNLEYLEANFYYLAAFGTTIDVSNSYSQAAGAPTLPISGGSAATNSTQGTVTVKPTGVASCKVPFATTQVASYCVETAIEEGKHVRFLYNALQTAGNFQVAQPAIDLYNSFNTLAGPAGANLGISTFDPFASDADFLVGAYIFEDVGVTAYSGAAPLISTTSTGKVYLQAAAGILAVEAYHGGLVRTSIINLDPTGSLGLVGYTTAISNLRAKLASYAMTSNQPLDGPPDDFGVATTNGSLAGATSVTLARTADADPTNYTAFARNTNQVLNIVTGGGKVSSTGTVTPKATGVFFPNGLNGLFS
jgi:hypothetical protein